MPRAKEKSKFQRSNFQIIPKFWAPFSALISPKSAMHPTDASDFNPGSMTQDDRRVSCILLFLLPRAKEKSKFQRSNFQIIPKFSAPFSALISHKNAMHPTDASDLNPGSMTQNDRRV